MNLRIWHKLALALCIGISLLMLAMAYVSSYGVEHSFRNYLNTQQQQRALQLEEQLIEDYEQRGDWRFIQDQQEWHAYLHWIEDDGMPHKGPDPHPDKNNDSHSPGRSPGNAPKRAGKGSKHRFSLSDADKQLLFGAAMDEQKHHDTALRLRGETIGYLHYRPFNAGHMSKKDRAFLQQHSALIHLAWISFVLAGVFSWLASAYLRSRIRPLSNFSQQLSNGNYDNKLSVPGNDQHDELGQLGPDLNHLSQALAQGKSARERWVADIAHELRTPLSILHGEIEAMQDGIRPLDQAALQSLLSETTQLSRIVEQLRKLSQAEMGELHIERSDCDLAEILRNVSDNFSARFAAEEIALTLHVQANTAHRCWGDASRLHQLFSNLLENSLRYTCAAGQLANWR